MDFSTATQSLPVSPTWISGFLYDITARFPELNRTTSSLGFPCGSAGKESVHNSGDLGSIPGLGKSPGEGKGYPLQYCGLKNFMDYIVHGVAKSRTRLSHFRFHQLSSVAQSCLTLCNPMDCSTPGFPVLHQPPELATHVHWVGDAIQPSHPLSSPSPPAFNLSQHQGLFKWVSSSHQVAKVLEFQLQHQSFQWIFRTDFL